MVLVSGSEDLVRLRLLTLELVVQSLLALLLDLEDGISRCTISLLVSRTYLQLLLRLVDVVHGDVVLVFGFGDRFLRGGLLLLRLGERVARLIRSLEGDD